jgi:dihydroorotate dehydrogenase electron transfer subunit
MPTTPAASGPSACGQSTTGPCHERVAVVAHRPIADQTWRIRVESPALAATATPGQFAMVRLPDRTDPLLARPLAVYDVFPGPDGRPRYVDFVYAVHGRFTTALAGLPPGEELAVWGPLGNGFDPQPVAHLVLVAGGIGQTALLALARERSGVGAYGSPARIRPPAERITFCWGGRTAAVFGDVADFEAAGCDVHLATLDGTTGVRGTVVDLLDSLAARGQLEPVGGVRLATCGPDAMMAAVARWTAARGIPCDASLETPMACGIGICFTCVAAIRDADGGWDYRRTCVEGPVFDAASIVW